MKARTKPIEVEAVRWMEYGDHPRVVHYRWQVASWQCGHCGQGQKAHGSIKHIAPRICSGDYIVTYPDGTIEVCKPDEFERKFERIGDE